MADILHEEIFSSLNFRVQSCPRVGGGAVPPTFKSGGGGGGMLPPCPPPPSPTPLSLYMHELVEIIMERGFPRERYIVT